MRDAAGHLLLSDLGIALLTSRFATSPTLEKAVAGLAPSTAPEQFLGEPQPVSDQYALALMAYEWLCGTPPFRGTFSELAMHHQHTPPPSLCARAPALPTAVDAVILCALAKQPAERFPSVEAFATALAQAATLPTPASTSAQVDAHQQSIDLPQAMAASHAVAYRHRGALYEQQGDVERAIADYTEALRLDPTDAAAYYNRDILYKLQGDRSRALADFNEALRLNPTAVLAYNNRAILYAEQGNVEQALADFNEALRLNPADPAVYYNCGILYRQQEDLERAIADFNEAIRLNPADSVITNNLHQIQQAIEDERRH